MTKCHSLTAVDLVAGTVERAQIEAELRTSKQRKPNALIAPGSLLTPAQAAARLACSIKTLLGYVDEGSLRYIDVSRRESKRRRIKFDLADLDEFKQKHRKQEPPPCLSSNGRARRTTTSTSKSKVFDFAALRAARTAEKRKP